MNVTVAQTYADDAARWQAVLRREPAADGAFYYAVHSTGIYCRATCPSRRPKRETVAFFDLADAAERAGFRACRRCRPREVSVQQQVVVHAQQILESSESTPTLDRLGEALGLSPFHVQRLFKRATGLTPRQYAAARRLERFKAGLKSGATVTEAMYDAGYQSSRALYGAARDQLGMSPGAYKASGRGERVVYGMVDSPLGRMLIAATERGVCALRFGQDKALIRELAAEFARATRVHDPTAVAPYAQIILEHLAGRQPYLDVPFDVQPTDFQQSVWAALRQIPYGETRTYKEIAQTIGRPNAVRAVARACAANPVPLIVPCHRVVRSNGDPGGYRWGAERKQILLRGERNRGQSAG